jgi:hypothetical protein
MCHHLLSVLTSRTTCPGEKEKFMRLPVRVLASSIGLAIASILSLAITVFADGGPGPIPR